MSRSQINAAQQVKAGSISLNLLEQTLAEQLQASTQIHTESLIGEKNGINTDFTVAGDYVSGGLLVFLGGQRIKEGADYTVDETTPLLLHFAMAPDSEDDLSVVRIESMGRTLAADIQTKIEQISATYWISAPGSSKQYSYNPDQSIASASDLLNGQARNSIYTYNEQGELTQTNITWNNQSVSMTYLYDEDGLLRDEVITYS